MSLTRAALMIREAQKPKKLLVYKIDGCWIVRNQWTGMTTFNSDFEDAMKWMDIELLERLLRA